MSRKKLEQAEIDGFIQGAPGWVVTGTPAALEKLYTFESYGDGIAFAVAVAFRAEKRDHHPDIAIGWAKVTLRWSTHDAGGVTALDRELAEASDQLARGYGGSSAAS